MTRTLHLMMKTMVLWLCLLSLPCMAERALRTLLIAPGNAPVKRCVLFDGKVAHPVELPQRNLSGATPLPDGEVVLYGLAKAPVEGEKLPAGAPSVRIPAAWTRCVLVFLLDSGNKVLPVKMFAVDASEAKMPLGHTLLLNCTQATLLAKFGKVEVTCKSGESVEVRPPRQDLGDYDVAIDCVYPGSPTVRPVCRSTWNHNPTVRQFLFATPDENRNLPHIWGVNDLPGHDKELTAEPPKKETK